MAVAGLCRYCEAHTKNAVRKLTLDWVELNGLLAADGSSSGEAPVSGSREAPIPIRPSIEALQSEIARETGWWATAVVEELGVTCPPLPQHPAKRVQAATDILLAVWSNFLDLPVHVHHVHDDGRDTWFDRDGLDGALVLLALHERTAFTAGRTDFVDYLPAPCLNPHCQATALIRRNGQENIECRRCREHWTRAEYDAHVNVLYLDLRPAA